MRLDRDGRRADVRRNEPIAVDEDGAASEPTSDEALDNRVLCIFRGFRVV